ncbi:hypothetical protein [Photobacterium swingsii]|uniref:hypothetical protein n=1 Tax=Photobacterium swingsii TaxID=680026 RepID=UPI003D0BBABA
MKKSTRLTLLGLVFAMPMMSSAADTLLPKRNVSIADTLVSKNVKLYDFIRIEDGVLTSKSKYLCAAPKDFIATMNESNVITIMIKESFSRTCRIGRNGTQELQPIEFSIDLNKKLSDYYMITNSKIQDYQFKIGNTITFEN